MEGGAGLTNFRNKELAMKFQWSVKGANTQFATIRDNVTGNKVGDKVWELRMNRADARQIFPKNNFWSEVIREWIANINPTSSSKGTEETLWFNSKIKVDGKLVFYRTWAGKGVWKVKDLLDDNGDVIATDQFERKYNIRTNFLTLNGLTRAIPGEWKEVNVNKEKHFYEVIEKVLKPTRIIYQKLCSDQNLLEKRWERYIKAINKEMLYIDYISLFQKINQITISSKLRSFQYKFLLQTVTTNIQLKYYQIKENDNCTFCKEQRESMKHLFFDCIKVQPLWE